MHFTSPGASNLNCTDTAATATAVVTATAGATSYGHTCGYRPGQSSNLATAPPLLLPLQLLATGATAPDRAADAKAAAASATAACDRCAL